MRPEKAYYIIDQYIQKTLVGGRFCFDKLVVCACDKLIKKQEIEGYPNENTEPYADLDCMNTLMYISDRFNCAMRLEWLRGCVTHQDIKGEKE